MHIAANYHCETGECPVWHEAEQTLYWADIPAGTMYRYDPATGRSEVVFRGPQIGGLVVQADGSILQFLQGGRVQKWDRGSVEVVCDRIDEEQGNRFNDARSDPWGRVLAGTMPGADGRARLYRFSYDGTPELLLEDVGQSNGMAFSAGGDRLYHTDTSRGTITDFVYRSDAKLGASRRVVEIPGPSVVPDGLAIDVEGNLWSAHWGGGCVERYTPEGRLLDRVAVPTERVASLAFGGGDGRDLYITTAREPTDSDDDKAGALFVTRSSVPGRFPDLGRIRVRA